MICPVGQVSVHDDPSGELQLTVLVPIFRLKSAMTDFALLMVKVHVGPVEEPQAPPHPAKTESAAAVATSVTAMPSRYCLVHDVPQLMPPGVDVTTPEPLPSRNTDTSPVVDDGVKVAVTALLRSTVTVQVTAVPEQAPPQPVNVDPKDANAVRVTWVPAGYVALHVLPQSIPLVCDVTMPNPVPSRETPKDQLLRRLNVAVTFRAWVMLTTHVPSPVQAPLHPANTVSGATEADNVTLRPCGYDFEHVVPQVSPSPDDTVPVPVPALVTLKVQLIKPEAKLAVTFLAAVIWTMHSPSPVQAPLHPINVPLDPMDAIRRTLVPGAKPALQEEPQLMPSGLEVTMPLPAAAPALKTVKVTGGGGIFSNVAVTA
jgi:hypothetical protein